tara:strand:+ start:6636 stop:6821 length:186 start_codon:yes stop_codon:yes gene_type:complete
MGLLFYWNRVLLLFGGMAYLLIFRFGLTDRRESFKNTKYKKPKLINQLFKKKYENNIFFKY